MSSTDDVSGNYGALRSRIEALKPAAAENRREVLWCDDGQRIGVSRDRTGRVEIFITGTPLQTSSDVISGNLAHNRWQRRDLAELVANRLLLPPAPHFDSIAAFLCSDLIENGVSVDPQRGFSRSEPVIEMAIQRLRLQGEAFIGLVGELVAMTALLDHAPSDRSVDIVRSWHGHVRSSRDFQLVNLGVEVKTTRGKSSVHRVQGVRQVEIGHGVGQVTESRFFLLSIGLEEVEPGDPSENSSSLPEIVDGLIERIGRLSVADAEATVALLLDRVSGYGGDGEPYIHAEMKHRLAFGQRWRLTFARAYDMTDPAIDVLRSADLARFGMVEADSVEFVVSLPSSVRGDLNPISGLSELARTFVRFAWGE
jgi:hypothetical protein